MPNYILVSLIFLAWAFFQLSGGSGFDADAAARARMAERQEADNALAARIAAAPPASLPAPVSNTVPSPTLAVARAIPAPEPQTARPVSAPEPAVSASLPATSPDATVATEQPPTEPAAETPPEAATPAAQVMVQDMRVVRPARANMRGGPGTNNAVLATLDRGTEVELLGEPVGGWVQLRVIENNLIGWMAQSLLLPVGN